MVDQRQAKCGVGDLVEWHYRPVFALTLPAENERAPAFVNPGAGQLFPGQEELAGRNTGSLQFLRGSCDAGEFCQDREIASRHLCRGEVQPLAVQREPAERAFCHSYSAQACLGTDMWSLSPRWSGLV